MGKLTHVQPTRVNHQKRFNNTCLAWDQQLFKPYKLKQEAALLDIGDGFFDFIV